MKVEVEVISTCTIKPPSPTPDHLQHCQLSFLDQIRPSIFMPLVLFYAFENNLTNEERSTQFKKSLSEALKRFYPLAGRLVENTHVNCNDEGIPFVEAHASCKLADILNNPIPNELNKFIPCDLDDVKDLLMVVQVTFFECGGMALGVGLSHKIADALSLVMFLRSWAAISRGDGENVPYPKFEAVTDLFPPGDLGGFNQTVGIMKKEDIVTRRLIFSASKIATLRDNYTNTANSNECQIGRPTRIEALSAFIWTRFMTATRAKDDHNKIYTLLYAVNLRTRMNPSLPDYFFGNISSTAIATLTLDDNDEHGYNGLVNKVRDALRSVSGDDDYLSKLHEGEKQLKFMKERAKRVINGEIISLNFTSLCRFALYEADFGWDKPVWVGSTRLNYKNLVVFLDTKSGDGIEAWINLKWEDMAKFEDDKELFSYASYNLDGTIPGF